MSCRAVSSPNSARATACIFRSTSLVSANGACRSLRRRSSRCRAYCGLLESRLMRQAPRSMKIPRLRGKSAEPTAVVPDFLRDHMDDVGCALQLALHDDEARSKYGLALGGLDFGPDDEVADARLIFQ